MSYTSYYIDQPIVPDHIYEKSYFCSLYENIKNLFDSKTKTFSCYDCEINISDPIIKHLVNGAYKQNKFLGMKRKRDLEQGCIYVRDMKRMRYNLHHFKALEKISKRNYDNPLEDDERPMDVDNNNY